MGRTPPEVAAARRASRRGRPGGSTVPLMRDRRRFETAAWFAATQGLGLGPSVAANVVAVLLSPRPLKAEAIGGLVLRLSGGVEHASLKGRADRVRRRADTVLRRRTDEEETWLIESASALVNLFSAPADAATAAYALDRLRLIGWAPILVGVAERITETLASNFPPASDLGSQRARELLEALTTEASTHQ